MGIYYRLSNTTDPEERLEDAAMAKALKDELGSRLIILDGGMSNKALAEDGIGDDDVVLGRHHKWQGQQPGRHLAPPFLRYWHDPAFVAAAGRFLKPCTYNQAVEQVALLHAAGKNAFIKSTATKEFTSLVPKGSTILDVAEDLVFSWLDFEHPVLVVQEAVEMRYEHRFAVMGRQIISHSPVMVPLTPLDTAWVGGMVSPTPGSTKLEHRPQIAKALREFAAGLVRDLEVESCILDCCMIGDEPAAIELNAMSVGQFGLFAMNVRELASGVSNILLPAAGLRLTAENEPEEEFEPDL